MHGMLAIGDWMQIIILCFLIGTVLHQYIATEVFEERYVTSIASLTSLEMLGTFTL